MGSKYMVKGFAYPYPIGDMKDKQTKYFIIALWWMIAFLIRYDGVDFHKRGRLSKSLKIKISEQVDEEEAEQADEQN